MCTHPAGLQHAPVHPATIQWGGVAADVGDDVGDILGATNGCSAAMYKTNKQRAGQESAVLCMQLLRHMVALCKAPETTGAAV